MSVLAIADLTRTTPEDLAAASRAWSDDLDADARLVVAESDGEALILGSFERASNVPSARVAQRGSGGASALVGPGVVWVQLSLARVDALVPCTIDKLLNRYVRPLLRAITKASGVPASYFGRDWISVAHRPAALLTFAHDATTGRALVEAFIAVSAPFAPVRDRPSYLGKTPASLTEILGRPVAPSALIAAVRSAYGVAATESRPCVWCPPNGAAVRSECAWDATVDEAVGTIAAGWDEEGRLRLGGELLASRDAVQRLEAILASGPDRSATAIGAAVDAAFGDGGAYVFGLRSLGVLRDVLVEAASRRAVG